LPFLNFYRVLLFPLASPRALLLDWWLGVEGITQLRLAVDNREILERSGFLTLRVLGAQIFIPRQEFLVHRPSDVGQHACPIHDAPLVPTYGVIEIPSWQWITERF
jgi:metal transporter CNNM